MNHKYKINIFQKGMKHIRIILFAILSITQGFSQRLYIEPDFGVYRPSEFSRIKSLVIGAETGEQEFNFNYSPRYGAKIGIIFPTDYQIYIGYKIWSNTKSNTMFNTLVYGLKGDVFFVDSNIGIRLGIELTSGKMDNELDTQNLLWELKLSGSGMSIETGIVYKLHDRVRIFTGLNYLSGKIILDRIDVEKDVYTRQDIGLKKSNADVNMNGMNIKIDISFILTNPLRFED